MPRFGVAFRRKSTATEHDYQNGQMTMDQPSSFRVIERTDPVLNNKSFDGGARMARSSGTYMPKQHSHLDLEDNMFADLKNNRGSGASNTTKATSTDASSRHSNASTAPSSADLAQDESKQHTSIPRKPLHEVPPRTAPKSSGSGFLNRAGRTFSFGQKKHGSASPKEDVPDVPPLPSLGSGGFSGRARGLTESTTSTATPPKLEEGGGLDLGGDFGSMFTSFDNNKRASMTLKNDGTVAPRSLTNPRSAQPAPLTIDKTSRVDPAPQSWTSRNSHDGLLGSSVPNSPDYESPPPVPRHNSSFKTSNRPSDIIEDEDAKLLQDSLAAGRLLSNNSYSNQTSRYQRDEDTFTSLARKPLNSSFKRGDDNMFEGSLAHSSRVAHRYSTRPPSPPRNKVMTPAQFEKYRQDRERNPPVVEAQKSPVNDDDDDEINYDDDEDEIEKSKAQAKQRRKQEAHMAVYRQQMMKVTGEQPELNPIERPSLPLSMSAPQLSQMQMKTPSPGPMGDDEEDEDEEIPLGILQAHGFPSKNRPPTRLANMGSNSNLRGAAASQQQRPGSVMGERDPPPATTAQRSSALPAFARNLPQDPFVGASIARPAVRESLQFSGGAPAPQINPSQSQPSLHPGGLVGVIASEERAKALRRGSPNIDGQKLLPNMNGPPPGFVDPINGIPASMMYSGNTMPPPGAMPGMGGMPGMPGMPGMGAGMLGMGQMAPQPPMLTVQDQAQLQMSAQMSQFMQMQMQFMQMMATNQNQNQLNQPYGGLAATQSMNDLTSRNSMVGEPMLMEPPRRIDAGMRTMSMVGPSSASFIQHPGYAGSIRASGMGYAPSIAPSERSNIGLPGRYRPVSQAPSTLMPPDNHRRTNTMSGALGNRWDETKTKSTINVVSKAGDGSDDDDDEGWEAMKAKRERKRTLWRSKKGNSGELNVPMI